jgi:hypothetical protein
LRRDGGERDGGEQRGRRWIFGLGLDGKDGHVRYTRGENFRLIGGSQDTHGEMQEKVIHLNEELQRRSKTLDEISGDEFDEIARDAGLKDEGE